MGGDRPRRINGVSTRRREEEEEEDLGE